MIINGNCWVAYFDFLGFKKLIQDFIKLNGEGNLDVFYLCYYADIVRIAKIVVSEVEKTMKVSGKIGFSYFSDTFIFFAPEDKPGSYDFYLSIDMILRHFFVKSLFEGFFFRGALSFGDFYANIKEEAFLGPALVDAYEYADKQDWFGVVLTPKVVERLKGTNLDVDRRADYAKYNVPIKIKTVDEQNGTLQIKQGAENLYSYRISKYDYVEEMIIQKQTEAKTHNPDKYEVIYKPKYEAVLKFIRETKLQTII